MKKIFVSMLMVAFSLSLAAATTARITLVGQTGGSSELFLIQDNSYSAAYESGSDVESMMSFSNSKSVLMYALVGTHFCEQVATNDFTNLELGFATNNVDNNYKLKFSDFAGEEFIIYDRELNQVITVNASTPDYSFSATAGRVQVNDRFIVEPAVDPTLCFNYNVLEINGHAGESLVVKKGEAEIVNEASLPLLYSKDLSDQKGRLVVTLNGKDFQIDANPDVTPAN